MWRDAAVMLAAGMGVPLLAALNAQLGVRIGSPAVAACVLFAVGLAVSAGVAVMTAGGGALARLVTQPPFFLFGGVLMAFYLLSITWIAPRFGLGNAILCVLMGQMVSAAIIELTIASSVACVVAAKSGLMRSFGSAVSVESNTAPSGRS